MNDKIIKAYYSKVTELVKCFRRIDIQVIKRELNAIVNGLAKGATHGEYDKKMKMIISDNCPADVNMIDFKEETESEALKDSWMKPIIDYLKDSKLSEDKN